MYEELYDLKTRPFQMAPDPAFLYWSESHRMAFTMLRYSLMNAAPITVITGDVGTGKTTLVRQLLDEFPGEIEVGLLSNVQAGRGELLEWVLMAFDQPYEGSHVQRFARFQQFAIERYAEGRQIAIIIDEAHNIGIEQLEELRLLSNINSDGNLLLQIILVGQPELRELLARPDLRQFVQRITADYHLAALEPHEIPSYIQHRLQAAGCDRELFPKSTCELIARATRGIPRLINVLCDLCLVYGYSSESPVIDTSIVRELMSNMDDNGIFRQFSPLGSEPTLVASKDPEVPASQDAGAPEETAKPGKATSGKSSKVTPGKPRTTRGDDA